MMKVPFLMVTMSFTTEQRQQILMTLGYGEIDENFSPDFVRELTPPAQARVLEIVTQIATLKTEIFNLITCDIEADQIDKIKVDMGRKFRALNIRGSQLLKELSSLVNIVIKVNSFKTSSTSVTSVK